MSNSASNLQGPATLTYLPEITLKGNSYERGRQYGKAFQDHLKNFYCWFVKKEPEEIITGEFRKVLDHMEDQAALHFPQLLAEMKGWADGSRLPYEKIRLLSFYFFIAYALRTECSNVIVTKSPEGPWLAANKDLNENERSWMVLRRCFCDDCYSYEGISYLGLPGVQGCNSKGLAVGGASLLARPPKNKKIFLNLAGLFMQTKATVRECLEVIEKFGAEAPAIHLALLDASGDALAAEIGADTCHIRRPDESGLLVVTSHSPSGKIPLPEGDPSTYIEISVGRYNRLMAIFRDIPVEKRTTQKAWEALSDHEGVCLHGPGSGRTIHSFVTKPGKVKSEIQLCWGYPCQKNFLEKITL